MSTHTQVLVIGGGPGGSTTAGLLARNGVQVTLLEREKFPRYHVGESVQPVCLSVLDALGARPAVEAHGFQIKRGTYFEWGGETWDFDFSWLPKGRDYGWQVIRSEFDQLLLENARTQGANVIEQAEVTSIAFDGPQPRSATWKGPDGATHEITFDRLVDASGRTGLLANRYLKSRRVHSQFQNVGVWGYWKNARRLDRGPEGAVITCSVPHGWLWAIPLHDGTTSIGLVLHKDDFKARREKGAQLEEMLRDAIAQSPRVRWITETGELVSPVRAEQDFSYTSDVLTGPGYHIVGDAALFLDPLLATGVHLSMFSGLLAAACVTSLTRGEVTEEEADAFYTETYRTSYLRLLVLVSTFYEQYKGNKATIFWEAQKMSHADVPAQQLQRAFANIVTGLEDMEDAAAAGRAAVNKLNDVHEELRILAQQRDELVKTMTPAEVEVVKAKVMFYSSVQGARVAQTPQSAIAGFFVATQPRLALVRASSVPRRPEPVVS